MTPAAIFAEAAPAHWAAGLPVIPLKPPNWSGSGAGKAPIIEQWARYCREMPSEEEQAEWLGRFSGCNIGVALGPCSGLCAIDIDTSDPAIIVAIEKALPPSAWRRVGAKGAVLAYRWSGQRSFQLKNEAGVIVEFLADGRQIAVPPSIHPKTGQPYAASRPLLDALTELIPLPDNVEEQLRDALAAIGVRLKQKKASLSLTAVVPKGARDSSMTSHAGLLSYAVLRGEMTLLRALETLRAWAATYVEHVPGDPLDIEKGERQLVAFFVRDVTEKRRALPDGWDDGLSDADKQAMGLDFAPGTVRRLHAFTEFGIRDRVVDMVQGRIVLTPRGWFEYSEAAGKWIEDPKGFSLDAAIELAILNARDEADQLPTSTKAEEIERAKVRRAVAGLQNERTVASVKRLCEVRLAAAVPFDRDPWLLNTHSGVLDLRTGQLREHRPELFLSKITGCAYDPEARCPTFLTFLNRIFDGNTDLISYIQRLFGYALTGVTHEHVFVIFHGFGRNGKSTLLKTAAAVFGDYWINAASSTFTVRRSQTIREDIARLDGPRLVTTSEIEKGARLDVALVKNLTGDETVTARELYRPSRDFRAICKVIMAVNHAPDIDGSDMALMRRLHLIPFMVTIGEDEVDHDIDRKLESELPGILSWMVGGCLEWQRTGLRAPASVRAAIADYGDEHDPVGRFLKERTARESGHRVSAAELYSAYVSWTTLEGYSKRLDKPTLGKELKRQGLQQYRSNRERGWIGIRLLTAEELAVEAPRLVTASFDKEAA